MALKIFIPEWHNEKIDKKTCVPLLYPFATYEFSMEEKAEKYGDWVNDVEFTKQMDECDFFMPAYFVNNYYETGRKNYLLELNDRAARLNKLTICWTKGDMEITPDFKHFHLFRNGGYLSKNKGNEFLFPPFFADPLHMYYDMKLTYHEKKTPMAVVGFCGQGQATVGKLVVDLIRNTSRIVKKAFNRWPYDLEENRSSTYDRSLILDALERSKDVVTNFIRHKKYRAGTRSKEDKEKSSREYFNNLKESQYILCYRGAGNYSVRLYETLAAGRIPLIVTSDNNLPYPGIINWNKFPVIAFKDYKKIGRIVYDFHASLTDEEFNQLQRHTRKVFEQHISYKGFMATFMSIYSRLKEQPNYKFIGPVSVPETVE